MMMDSKNVRIVENYQSHNIKEIKNGVKQKKNKSDQMRIKN